MNCRFSSRKEDVDFSPVIAGRLPAAALCTDHDSSRTPRSLFFVKAAASAPASAA
ncbi:MAG: hypothetical protein LBG42_06430 [Treponema sp.]|nr:hypothetical protein [Treponema sp.]